MEEPKDKKEFQCRYWFATINNPTISGPEFMNRLKGLGSNKGCFQLEICPSTGTPHFQATFEFRERVRASQLNAIHAGHYVKRQVKRAFVYCCKEESRAPGDGSGPWKWGILEPRTIPTGLEGKELYPWQSELLAILKEEPTDLRKVHWYWSEEGGRGKTSLIREILKRPDACWVKMDSYNQMVCAVAAHVCPDMVGARSEEKELRVMIVDCARNAQIDYTFLENLKDGLLWNSKYRPGVVRLAPAHVVVFANVEPYASSMTLSADRLRVVNVD